MDYILYAIKGEPNSEKALSFVARGDERFYVQDPRLLEGRPEWLDGVPILACIETKRVFKGTNCLLQLHRLQRMAVPIGATPPDALQVVQGYPSGSREEASKSPTDTATLQVDSQERYQSERLLNHPFDARRGGARDDAAPPIPGEALPVRPPLSDSTRGSAASTLGSSYGPGTEQHPVREREGIERFEPMDGGREIGWTGDVVRHAMTLEEDDNVSDIRDRHHVQATEEDVFPDRTTQVPDFREQTTEYYAQATEDPLEAIDDDVRGLEDDGERELEDDVRVADNNAWRVEDDVRVPFPEETEEDEIGEDERQSEDVIVIEEEEEEDPHVALLDDPHAVLLDDPHVAFQDDPHRQGLNSSRSRQNESIRTVSLSGNANRSRKARSSESRRRHRSQLGVVGEPPSVVRNPYASRSSRSRPEVRAAGACSVGA